MRVLLTNDDSHASPLLHFLIEYLHNKVDLTVVAPRYEQSWKGKSITRFESMTLEEIEVVGFPVTTVDGSPADCANIGIHHVCPEPPDLVISGINAGQNAGIGFIFSSGTVGACLEANIAGIPAIALSQHLDWQVMSHLNKGDVLPSAVASRLREQGEKILDRVMAGVHDHEVLLKEAITFNINFPFVLEEPMKFTPTSIGYNFYGSLFSKNEDGSVDHNLRVITRDTRPDTDADVLESGQVSVSLLDMRTFGQLATDNDRELAELF